jgi:translation elongation factor EF-Tu-like GTPase
VGATQPDIEVILSFLKTEDGGRASPCRPGENLYRPLTNFRTRTDGFSEVLYGFVDKETVVPGESVRARGWFLTTQYQAGRLHEGHEFMVQEGPKIVARGTITKIINPVLEKPRDQPA